MKQIFTFWEGPMPAYIKLCMATWKFPYVVLDYKNLKDYTDLCVDNRLTRFTLPQIADVVRVHVLRDHGGYWLDADTILTTDNLPDVTIFGNSTSRSNSIGFLYAEPNSDMFTKWAKYQDNVINQPEIKYHWNLVGNAFTDPYLKEHTEIKIGTIEDHWPEVYMIEEDIPRWNKYQQFYFGSNYHLDDIKPADLIMLHNSWTPDWYKRLPEEKVLSQQCTLSNILREAT